MGAFLALLLASVLPLDELPPQVMAKNSCAMFLWDRASKRRVVMMVAVPEPAVVRVASGGKVMALAQIAAEGDKVLGFAPRSRFGDGRFEVAIDVEITANDGVVGGGVVRDGTLTVTQADGVAVVAPVAGLIGCG